MSHRREVVIGHTVLGRPIEAIHFTPPSYAKPRPPALLFGAIHGDEAVTQLMLERLADELIERPPGRETWIVPCVNVDGVLAGTRNNANDIDLNRNFASASWGTQRRPGYNPGQAAEDQPETQALVDADRPQSAAPDHRASTRPTGWSTGTATASSSRTRWPSAAAIPSSTTWAIRRPGSFGTKYGVEQHLEVITLEVPYLMIDERAWTECRTALRWCVDLPA